MASICKCVRRGACPDRTQWCRQDHAGGAARRANSHRTAGASCSTRATSPAQARTSAHASGWGVRFRSRGCSRASACWSIWRSPCRPPADPASAPGGRWRARPRCSIARARCASPRAASPRRVADPHAVARPAASARGRHGDRRRAATGAARRTHGRLGRGRVAAHGSADRQPAARGGAAADRTRRRRGVPARRSGVGAGRRTHHRQRQARRGAARSASGRGLLGQE